MNKVDDMSGNEAKVREEEFHDQWANSTEAEKIDVIKMNETCTAPEMRHISRAIGNMHGKKILDVGCGLGEASVYFAVKGADVTATDLSQGMLDNTQALADAYGVKLRIHKSDAEDLRLGIETFDVIYVGNLFHHVEVEATIRKLVMHLKPDGMMVSWDPLTYNPLINLYRRIATEVRTPDEHPFTLKDIKTFRKYFTSVDATYYWLTTLSIFVHMFLIQLKNPNKLRFWKKVVEEGDSWAWLYEPLAKLDRIILKILPFLGPLCWNVVLVSKGPIAPVKLASKDSR